MQLSDAILQACDEWVDATALEKLVELGGTPEHGELHALLFEVAPVIEAMSRAQNTDGPSATMDTLLVGALAGQKMLAGRMS